MNRLALLSVIALSGCAAPPIPVAEMVQEWASYLNRDHVLVPGDTLTVSAFQTPELTQEVVVSPQGSVSLRRLEKPMHAVGRTISDFRASVEEAYDGVAPGVEISINLTRPNPRTVYVAGEVFRPGPLPWASAEAGAKAPRISAVARPYPRP